MFSHLFFQKPYFSYENSPEKSTNWDLTHCLTLRLNCTARRWEAVSSRHFGIKNGDSYGRNGAENGHINKCIYIYIERESAFILLMPVKLDDDHGGRDDIYIYTYIYIYIYIYIYEGKFHEYDLIMRI